MDQALLSQLIQIDDIPTLPEVMSRILETIEDEGSSSKDLTKILEYDHAISARVLRMANSAFYGLPSKVESIRRAVVVIGFDAVKMLALATSVFDTLNQGDQFAINPEDFWMHSLGAAKAGQIIAEKRSDVEAPEVCFTGGLLHDMGKYLLALVMKEQYTDICREAKNHDLPLREVERKVLEVDHSAVGAWVARKWHFPASIVDCIEYLYKPEQYAGSCKAEVGIVALSDVISRMAEFGQAGDPRARALSTSLDNSLDMGMEEIVQISQELQQARDDTRQMMNLMKSS